MKDYSILSRTQYVGAKKMLLGIALFSISIGIVLFLFPAIGFEPDPFGLAALAAPGALVLIGFIEVVTNTPFSQIASRWDQLRGWQRGIIGTMIVLIVLVIIIFGMTVIVVRWL